MKIFTGVFTLIMGNLMIIVWSVPIATGQHDFQIAMFESISLLVAEALTSFTLVIGGNAILARKNWGFTIHLTSFGMMLYTSVNSIGVFAQAGIIPVSIFFAVLTLSTIFLILMWTFRSFHERQTFPSLLGERI